MRYFPDAAGARTLSTEELRSRFLFSGLFEPGKVVLNVTDLDRLVVGGAVPRGEPLRLEPPPGLAAEYFTQRRELGALNIGGSGTITVDGKTHRMSKRDVLYVGKGARDVGFASDDPAAPARYYLVSYPAHASHPTSRVTASDAHQTELGSADKANRRRISRYIHADGVKSGQLVMGVTVLEPGSVWNTMPAHTHNRRTEIYLYFDLPADAVVVHLMGEPRETRSIIVRDGEAVLSPGWSIHTGCGTSSYSFCWAMGGENQDYADMDPVDMRQLR
ncbi:MAG TPA: 5-dehydro-4-deoxy-D-glucuronate isomerase [Gemmatimonadaceae bacterium]|nr:5-dehydro-4-deoxy-D-glucuronate isomerase [Gemmatimonadaceae bacterium]